MILRPEPSVALVFPPLRFMKPGRLLYNEGVLAFRHVWDYDIDDGQFREILAGRLTVGRLDRDWAAVRILENAPYEEIVGLLGFGSLVEGWPRWRSRIRSQSRRRGFDFLVAWLPDHHPEVLR